MARGTVALVIVGDAVGQVPASRAHSACAAPDMGEEHLRLPPDAYQFSSAHSRPVLRTRAEDESGGGVRADSARRRDALSACLFRVGIASHPFEFAAGFPARVQTGGSGGHR